MLKNRKSMLIKKLASKKFSIAGGTEGLLYPSSPDEDFTVAQVTMDGKYPQKGYSINDISKETLFMLDGCFEVGIEKEKFILKKGDMLIIFPNKKYCIKGKGTAIDIITPAWEKNKNKIVVE